MSTITQVATRALGDDIDSTFLTDFQTYVTEAIQTIYRETKLKRGGLMISAPTVPGSYAVTMPATLVGARIANVFMGDTGHELDEVDAEDMKQLQLQNPASSGRPLCWAEVAPSAVTTEPPTIEVWPKAGAVYTLWFSGQEAVAATDLDVGDPVPLPTAWERVLVYWARHEHFMMDSDWEGGSVWEGKFEKAFAQLRADLQGRPKNRVVPGTWSNLTPGPPSFHYPGIM